MSSLALSNNRYAPWNSKGAKHHYLNKEPLTFRIDDLDWTFELTWEGEDAYGKYRLKLNGCPVEKLQSANFQKEIPPLSKSTVLDIDTDAYKSVFSSF